MRRMKSCHEISRAPHPMSRIPIRHWVSNIAPPFPNVQGPAKYGVPGIAHRAHTPSPRRLAHHLRAPPQPAKIPPEYCAQPGLRSRAVINDGDATSAVVVGDGANRSGSAAVDISRLVDYCPGIGGNADNSIETLTICHQSWTR